MIASACQQPFSLRFHTQMARYVPGATNCTPPAPVVPKYRSFEQTLDIEAGLLTISSGGAKLQLFADWNADVIRIRLTAEGNTTAKIVTRNWRNVSRYIGDCSKMVGEKQSNAACKEMSDGGACFGQHGLPSVVSIRPDTVVDSPDGELMWYRRNPPSTIVDASMKQQLLNGSAETRDILAVSAAPSAFFLLEGRSAVRV